MDLVGGHHRLRALLAPSRELPQAPAWGIQKQSQAATKAAVSELSPSPAQP